MDFRSLTKKKGPLPIWAWAIITAGILYLAYRHFRGSGSTAASPTLTDAGSQAATPTDVPTGPVDTSGNGVTPVEPPGTTVGDQTQLPWWADPNYTYPDIPPLDSGNPTDPTTVNGTPVIPAHAVPKATSKAPAPLKSIIPGITGSIKSQKVLPNGAKLVTLQSGKQIEQAKGKKAYIVKKGK